MTPELRAEFNYILDTFGGAANGRFIKFMRLLEYLEAKRTAGDEAAAKVLHQVTLFKRLLEAAENCK
ncbi:MAG: hypothetical protein ACYSWO_08645 [Planctomycetota bacterium]|jgi:hypothetical protein